jgi:hypothetical protein
MLDILEYVDNDAASIKTVHRLLKHNGTVIITVPAYMHLWSNHDIVLEHKRRYTKEVILSLFNKEEWQIEKVSYFNTILYLPILFVRLLNKTFRPNRMETDGGTPSTLINGIFTIIMKIERKWLRHHQFWFGVSLLLIAKKR